MAAVHDLIPSIYHEKQQPGEMLCAQHALNSLLQGQYFSAPDLSEIARELDEHEQRELDQNERATTSNNMDDTGFFSVQVLQKALSDTFNLSLVPWGAQELRPYHQHPHTQMAFILNHAQHWYTLRRFGSVSPDPALEADPGGGHWFNLNSFNVRPERIGKLYLGMFLQQAQEEGYSIFATIQQDPSAKIALPRVEADELFASIPEDAAGNFSNSYTAAHASSSSTAMHGVEGLEDEDVELQRALQASLGGGDYGDYIPQRFESAARGRQQPPSRTSSRIPIQREYEVIDSDDEDIVIPQAHADPEPEPEPVDPVAASMARQRAIMEHMQRAQQYALQEQYQDEIARMNAAARLRQAREGDDEDEDEMLRRAIAESEAMAQAQGSSHAPQDEDEDEEDAPAPPPRAPPAWHQHRVYDDEDQELQAALRASMETVPPGFRVPSPQPVIPQRPSQESTPPAQTSPPPLLQRQASSDIETESEGDATEAEPEQLSMEEIRRRRLARFGG